MRYLLGILLWVSGTAAFAQLSLRGHIESTTGEVLPFVHVVNASQQVVVVSDINGFFAVVAAVGDTIDFSLVGFQPDRIIVGNDHYQQLQKVVLIEDSILLPGITILDRPLEPIIKLPERKSMSVTGVRGKEGIVHQGIIRFDMGTPGESTEVVPMVGVSGSLTGVFTYLYERFSKAGKERRKYAESLQQSREESVYNVLIHTDETAEIIKRQYQLTQSEYERLIIKFNIEFPDAKKLPNQSEIWGLLHFFFSQNTSE